MTRKEAQVLAERKYEEKRDKTPVSFRLSDEELERLDKARGEETRAAFAKAALLAAIGRRRK